MAVPGSLIPWIDLQFHDANSQPLAGGFVQAYATGTLTPQDTYADALLTTPNQNPIPLGSDGRPETGAIFLGANGYDFEVQDQDHNVLYTIPYILNSGSSVVASISLAAGSRNVTSGYTVLPTDVLITVASSGGANPCIINLPQAVLRVIPITIKNMGNIPLAITPFAGDMIENALTAYALAASAGAPLYPTLQFMSDGSAGYWIPGGIGV